MRKYLVFGVIALVALGASGWAGFYLNDQFERGNSLPARIQLKVNGYLNAYLKSGEVETRKILTNKAILNVETVYLPIEVADFAGGIDDINGESVLLTDRTGKLFHFQDLAFARIAVTPPDNNITALRSLADQGAFDGRRVRYKWFRYNDVLHVAGPDGDLLYISYSYWNSDETCVTSRLSRVVLEAGSAPEDWDVSADDWDLVTEALPCIPPLPEGQPVIALEAGGRLAQENETSILWTTGVYERDDLVLPEDYDDALAQSDDSQHGRVHRINIDTGALAEVARGLRNPQGITVDRDGQIWVTDHGMRGGDELNLVVDGANFGWPAVTYGTHYDLRPGVNAARHGGHEGYDLPTVAFVPSIAPGTAIAIDNFHDAWDGDILIGALRKKFHRVHMGERAAIFVEPIPFDQRIRDMAMLDTGKIAVWTDDRQLVYLSVDGAASPIETIKKEIIANAPESVRDVALETFDACLQCHALFEEIHGSGPSLAGICGADIASTSYDTYSESLLGVAGDWDLQRLTDYIADPTSVAEETSMPWGGVERGAASAVAAAFCALKTE